MSETVIYLALLSCACGELLPAEENYGTTQRPQCLRCYLAETDEAWRVWWKQVTGRTS